MNETFLIEKPIEIHPVALIMPPMDEAHFKEFKEDILGNGLLEPVVIFQDKIIDGRNRYNACTELGIDIYARQWEGGMDPVEYVVSKNIHRRQLTPSQRAMAAAKALEYWSEEAKERQRAAGGDKKSDDYKKSVKPISAKPIEIGSAAKKAGKAFDVGKSSVKSAKTVIDKGTESEKKAVETGKASVSAVEKQIKEREKVAPKATFNKTTDSISWAKWTWNPATGCKHGCPYCYARDMTKRYPEGFPNGFEPMFYENRLDAPINTKMPETSNDGWRRVFVCSMADLFGDWVPDEWIEKVLNACRSVPEWTYVFLTKNPSRLVGINFPVNAWVGITVDTQDRVESASKTMAELDQHVNRPPVIFVSCEPLQEKISFNGGLKHCDLVIIGGRRSSSGMPEMQPEWDWVESLHFEARQSDCKIFWKPNLKVRPMELP